MEMKYIPRFRLENGYFQGAYVFCGEKFSYCLNAQNGVSGIFENTLLDSLEERSLEDDLVFKLIQRGFVDLPHGLKCVCEEKIQPKFFIFDLTKACNFRCIYCFRHLQKTENTISDEKVTAIAEYILQYCQKHKVNDVCIQPWGGEPLIAFDKIKRMDDIFKAAGFSPLISIETNASLITPQLAQEADRRNIRLGVSIDGFEAIQNFQRPFANGQPSFRKMMQGLNILSQYEHLKNFGVVTVLTSISFEHLEALIEFFAVELKIPCFKLNLVKDSPVMKDKGLCLSEKQIYESQQILIRKLVELNQRGYAVTELNVQEKLMNLLNRSKSNICTSRGCMGGIKMIAFDQDGRIFPCDLTDYKEESIGTVQDGIDLIDLIVKAQKDKEFFNIKHSESCATCPYHFFCKGGCTTAIKYKKGKVEGVDQQECVANRSLYPELIHLILNDPKAVKALTRGKVTLNIGE